MTTLSMPTTGAFRRIRFGLLTNTGEFVSPLSKSVQTLEVPGARWCLEVSLKPMEREDGGAEWAAFLASAMGMAGRIYGFDPNARTPRGAGGGLPVVNGASQVGKTLNFHGADSHITNWLRKGDYFEVNGELKLVTAEINTGSGGAGTLQFVPPLRQSPANGSSIVVTNPKCTMRLASDEEAFWDIDAAVRDYGIDFKLVEVFTE